MDKTTVEKAAADACKMHTWTLHFITWYSNIFSTYKMLCSCF
jgi:hypothetical protein